MEVAELQNIKNYWTKKYPTVDVALWTNEFGTKFYGRMSSYDRGVDLSADTLGELISKGEAFLRTMTL